MTTVNCTVSKKDFRLCEVLPQPENKISAENFVGCAVGGRGVSTCCEEGDFSGSAAVCGAVVSIDSTSDVLLPELSCIAVPPCASEAASGASGAHLCGFPLPLPFRLAFEEVVAGEGVAAHAVG